MNSLLAYARPLQLTPRAGARSTSCSSAPLLLARDDLAAKRVASTRRPAALPPVHADADLISQLLLGLLGNAAEAMVAGGRIRWTRAPRTARCNCTSPIPAPASPAEIRERIFEPFFTTRRRGTGLGLAVARQIVEAHGGRIEVGAADGGGARFTLTLPAAAAAVLAA